MKTVLLSYGSALLSLLIIDGVWLGIVAKRFYASSIGHLMAATPNWYAAGLFYLLYTAGLVYVVIFPAIEQSHSVGRVFFMGAVVGALAYGTYDLTNLATLKDWPIAMTVIDMLWGALLTGLVSYAAVTITRIVL